MKSINIAKTIVTKRGEKGITQDELASFMGVSRVSVSKWETGQTYPDIVLLPQLAAYFDISMDELMGYEPQMTEQDIHKLCTSLSDEFAVKSFDEMMVQCREITKKYFSCFPLLFQIGLIYINHSVALTDNEKKISTLSEAKELFIRVKTLCDNIELKHYALHGEAVCELMLGNPNKVVVLLENEKTNPNVFHPSTSVMLSQSYQMLGNIKDAKITLQSSILDNIVGFFNNIPPYLGIITDDIDHFEEVIKRTLEMSEVFKVQKVNPVAILPFYLAAASGYITLGKNEKALEMLETYTEIVASGIFPLKATGDSFFTFIEDVQNEMPFRVQKMPRDNESIKQSLVNSVILNPQFAVFNNEANLASRYLKVIEKLKNLPEVTNEN